MANQGVAPVNLESNVGRIRILLGDTDPINVSGGFGEYLFFSDDELSALLAMYEDNPKLAAARALETIAGSQALMLKSWSSDDLSVRGDLIAKELINAAKQLRSEAADWDSSDFYSLIQTVESEHHREMWWN